PKLRPVEAFPIEAEGRQFLGLRDTLQYVTEPVLVPRELLPILQCFDGQHTILDIQTAHARKTGEILFSDVIKQIIEELDSRLMLDSEKFHVYRQELEAAFREQPTRPAAHAGGAYPNDAEALRAQLMSYFQAPEGPGLPDTSVQSDSSLVGAVAPHIDLRRGGPCFAHAYKEIIERSNADLFIILGVKHTGYRGMYTATYKDFETPLGTVKTDTDFIDLLQQNYDGDLREDEFFHKNEHSVEFQAVFLQALLGGVKPFRVVPIICSSFDPLVIAGGDPRDEPSVYGFIDSLRHAIQASDASVCILASVDFSHVGGRFGDRFPLNTIALDRIRTEDLELLQAAESVDTQSFLETVRRTKNRRRVDGVCPIYTLLETLQPTSGKLLRYDQGLESETNSVVTFASMGFYGKQES
ncbi:MAG: AmmeMemoRadiSam system protein B, partial [Candidatus Poribacteria bacterium]|nr:AmmeMemoRadiSam system protein B [Candidatus Poribacteria bacterium]